MSGVAWTLSRLCHKTLPSVLIVRQILPALVQLIHNDDYEIYDPACLCLTKLTNDFENDLEIRYERIQEVVDAGFVPRLVALLNPNKVSFYALETICNIVSGNDAQPDSVLAAGVCPLLAKLLVNTGTYIIEYAARTVSEFAAGNETQIQALVTNNVIRPLVDVLSNVDFERQKQAARAITNIACGNLFQFYWCRFYFQTLSFKFQGAMLSRSLCCMSLVPLLHFALTYWRPRNPRLSLSSWMAWLIFWPLPRKWANVRKCLFTSKSVVSWIALEFC